ncbi:MAG: class I SAM-dependent methyltransferase [Isosphaeraceae bacterium]|nr:class I SAM-dependent methyltransferase [Isosphaeraceae bacterium]
MNLALPQLATRPGRKPVRGLLRRLLPVEFQPPRHLPRRVLAALGYYRLRTWVGARGEVVPEAGLYQPLFSPWEGLPEFEALYQRIRKHTLVSRDRCYLLAQTLRQALRLEGDIVECGVFRGGTALLEALIIAEQGGPRALHLFDSFAGMPEMTEGIDRFKPGDFSSTSAEAVAALLGPYPFVQMHVGFIPETFRGLELGRVAWAHIDVDIYQAVRDCIEFLYPRLAPGGFLIFDDYGFPSCPGARRAVDEAFATRPEVPICLPTGQCLVVKLGGA